MKLNPLYFLRQKERDYDDSLTFSFKPWFFPVHLYSFRFQFTEDFHSINAQKILILVG